MKKSLLIFGILGLMSLGGMVAGALYFGYIPMPGASTANKPETPSAGHPEMGPVVKLGPLTLNLKEEEGRHYLKTTIFLEIGQKDRVEEIQSRMSLFLDRVILTVSEKRLEDLKHPESRENLRKELLEALNQHSAIPKIKGIYFDEFLFQ